MTYAVQQDLVDRFGETELAQLTDRSTGAFVDVAVLNRALADADAEIDSYLASRYQLPLSSAPVALVRVAADIARYRLFDDRVTEAVRDRYQEAVAYLKQIAIGNVVIDGAAALTPASTAIAVKANAPERVFNADLLGLY